MPIDGISLLEEFNVVICEECHMAYADRIPEQERIDAYYRNFSKYETNTSSSEWNDYDQIVIDNVSMHLPDTSSKIVDIGCGKGKILKELKLRGYSDLVGVELSDLNCSGIRASGIRAINKSLFELVLGDFPDKSDCVILMAVLEHIADLHSSIKIISGLLRDSGFFIVTVPNLGYFMNDIQYPFEEISMEHINYFDDYTLELLMRLHGFKQIDSIICDGTITAIFIKTAVSKSPMLNYVSECKHVLSQTINMIDHYYKTQKPIALYGVGTLCQYLLANTLLSECNIIQIVDGNRNYQGRSIGTRRISPPASLSKDSCKQADIIVVSYRYNDEIIEEIKNMRLSNKVISFPVKKSFKD